MQIGHEQLPDSYALLTQGAMVGDDFGKTLGPDVVAGGLVAQDTGNSSMSFPQRRFDSN
jgi:hypothetical protein